MSKEENTENIIEIKNLKKDYKMYNSKKARLLEAVLPFYKNHQTFSAINDLDLTKQLVQKINDENNEDVFFNIMLIDNNTFNNEAYQYMIYNLNVLINKDIIRWNYQTKQLFDSLDNKAMRKFVITFLEENTVIPDYAFPALKQLCVTIDRYDLLNKIRLMEDKQNVG